MESNCFTLANNSISKGKLIKQKKVKKRLPKINIFLIFLLYFLKKLIKN